MKRIIGMSLVAILVLVASTIYADVIHFKSGRKMEGKIIKETKDKITLKTDYATLTFSRDGIASIERKPYVFKEKKIPLEKTIVIPKKEPKKQYPILDRLISIDFTDAPMKAVFDFFSKMTQREVKYDGNIKELGVITIRVTDIPLKEAMDKIAQQKGLKYEIKDDAIIFTTGEGKEQKAIKPVTQPGKLPTYKDTPEFEHPAGLAYVQWSFDNSLGSKDITFDIKIYNALDVSNGIYFGVYYSKINGIPFYLGLQTDVYKSGQGGQGKGVIFSRWETTDKSNVKTEAPTSWAEAPSGEGRTVSLRCKYEWTNHKYRFKISEVSKDSIGVWYGFWVHDYNNNETAFIGSIRFPFTDDNGGPENCGISFIEIYSGTKIISNIPYWHVSIDSCFQDTNEPISAYAYYGKIPNTNIYLKEKSVHFEIGSNTVRNNLEGHLFE